MRKLVKYIWLAPFLYLLLACEKEIDLNVMGEPKLVVNSLFNPDSVWSIHVSKTVPVLSQQAPPPVNDAVVQLFEDGVLLEELTEGVNGKYTSATHKPVVGKNYQIQVTNAELGKVQSRESMNLEKVEIIVAQFANVRDADNEYALTLQFQDPAGVKNYYIAKVYMVDEKGNVYETSSRTDELSASSDILSDNGISFSDVLFDGKEYSFRIKLFFLHPKILVELRNVSEAYYHYHRTQHIQEYNMDDPFSTTLDIYNNIENGVGIFASYQADTVHVLPQK